jgi:hypothetical protein
MGFELAIGLHNVMTTGANLEHLHVYRQGVLPEIDRDYLIR